MMNLAKLYFISRPIGEKLNEKGKAIPLTEAEIEQGLDATVAKIEQAFIGNEYKEVKEAWDIFTEINAKTIDFAVDSGMII